MRHLRVIGDDGPGVHSDDVCSGANPVGHTVGIDAGVVLLRRGDAQGGELTRATMRFVDGTAPSSRPSRRIGMVQVRGHWSRSQSSVVERSVPGAIPGEARLGGCVPEVVALSRH